ncbi:hypothetical protein [Flagellimonas flava]
METEYLLTGKNREILLKSIKELKEGNCIQKKLEDLADIDFAKER